MNRLRPGAGRGDAGFGLPEFLVAIGISGILLLALGSTFTGSLRTSKTATTRVSDTAELRLAMDTVARRLRVAVKPKMSMNAFEVANPRSVRFYAAMTKPGVDTEQPPTLVEYTITSTCLQEVRKVPSGTTEATWSWTSPASTVTTCLARGAVNADGGALFTYFGSGDLATATALSGPTTGVATADLPLIRGVQARADVKASTASPVAASKADTRVTLVNLLPIS